MTLIEVVAGLGLLATVLTLVFSARGHIARQQVRADRRLEAVAAADALLAAWWRDPATFPTFGRGVVPGHPDLIWQTSVVPNTAAEALGSQAVKLQVVAERLPSGGPPLVVTVEVVVPVNPAPEKGPTHKVPGR